MKNKIVLAVKGFIMGIGNVIPGVSGGTLALTLGIYEQFISSISHLLSNLKENLKFLIPVGIGMVLAIISMSSLITDCFNKFPLPTSTFFMGLVIGGLPLIFNKVKGKKTNVSNFTILGLAFALVMVLAFADQIFGETGDVSLKNVSALNMILLFIVGVIASATMVIPGVSGSLVLMLLGFYFPILKTIKSFFTFNHLVRDTLILGAFGLGVLVGIVLVAKLIEFLFAKFEVKTYYGVIGFIVASIIAIPVSVYNELGTLGVSVLSIIAGLITLIVGMVIGYKLGEK